MNKQEINRRIGALRALLKREQLAACIVPSTDPHLSEYVASHWKSRAWLSGFTGSAGTLVVTHDKAGLWTDSRYFIQGAEQLKDTPIELYKQGLPETPDINEFLANELAPESRVGIDGRNFQVTAVEELISYLDTKQIILITDFDPVSEIWESRPPIPQSPAFIYSLSYAGKSTGDKIQEIRSRMSEKGVSALFLSALDEIAWTLNLRGNDVKCNPVVISYLLITNRDIVYFIDPAKLTGEVSQYLKQSGVTIRDYDAVESYLSSLDYPNILLEPAKTNYSIYTALSSGTPVVRDESPVSLLKAVRNPQEIAGVHNAMIKDGVALVRFLKWLEEAVPEGGQTEISIDKKLHAFRNEQEHYMGESFDTIAGYKEHAAIVHYSATAETDAPLKPEGFLLLDSGAQYLDGTTDITRTIALGPLTDEEKLDYTLVLKGHIALARAVFPAGTRGAQLDILARLPLWQQGMNFLHGTGHGIGHLLNVHEGPQSIRMNENPTTLLPGMVTSNEPGIYKSGSHGIRIENLILTVKDKEGMYGDYLRFETITLCPICTRGIIVGMLSPDELDWLNSYHREVFDKLSPLLNKVENEWLKEKTKPLTP